MKFNKNCWYENSTNAYYFLHLILILNTDFHKKQDKNKMKFEEFCSSASKILKEKKPSDEELLRV